MAKVVAIATADWHIHKFRAFDKEGSRLRMALGAAQVIFDSARALKVPILFSGDLFHTPKEVENETMALTQKLFHNNRDVPFIAISGNHDMAEKNSHDHRSPTHLDSFRHFPNFHCVDDTYYNDSNLFVRGVPYMNNDADIVKRMRIKGIMPGDGGLSILLLHSDAPGAVTPEGIKLGETEHINYVMFEGWDLVLFGHIHKAQLLHAKKGTKAFMLGCPIHQNAGDAGNPCGYWEVREDGTMNFIELTLFPQFVRLKPGEIPREDGNYYIETKEVLEESEVSLGEFNINKSKKKLAMQYCKLKGTKSKTKLKELIKVLNDAE